MVRAATDTPLVTEPLHAEIAAALGRVEGSDRAIPELMEVIARSVRPELPARDDMETPILPISIEGLSDMLEVISRYPDLVRQVLIAYFDVEQIGFSGDVGDVPNAKDRVFDDLIATKARVAMAFLDDAGLGDPWGSLPPQQKESAYAILFDRIVFTLLSKVHNYDFVADLAERFGFGPRMAQAATTSEGVQAE